MDLRLVSDRTYEDHPGNKISVCARKVAEIYQESTRHRGTQIVFSDIGTPKTDAFNVYDALKEKLIAEHGVQRHEITFIHDWTDAKKPELFRRMNNGDIRILIGSTEKAGTGLNVQERMVAMHHLDIPWKPSELEQRNGRGARQGNRTAKEFYGNKIPSFIYAVEQSLDNYKFNLLKNKQLFISQMKNSELNVRSIDEGSIDEKSGMNFSEYIAILSGDTTLLEKSKLEKKVAVIESLKTAHYREATRSGYQLDRIKGDRESNAMILEKLTKDDTLYRSVLKHDAEGSKQNPVQLNGLASSDPEAIGKYILTLHKNWKPDQDDRIGALYGFDLYIRRQSEMITENGHDKEFHHNTFYATRPETGIKYTYNNGNPNVENPKLAARHFLNAIDRVDALVEKYTRTVSEQDREITLLTQIVSKPFEKDEELKRMKEELGSMERSIANNILEKKMREAGELSSESAGEKKEIKPDAAIVIPLNQGLEHGDKVHAPLAVNNNRYQLQRRNEAQDTPVKRAHRMRI